MFDLLQTLRSTRFAVFALVLAAAAQLSIATHSVLVEHSPGEHCEVCIGQDRTDDAVPVTGFDVAVDSNAAHQLATDRPRAALFAQ